MRIDIMTLFPDSMAAILGESIIGRGAAKGLLDIRCHQIRDFTENKQKQVDDYPYGGGWGCVMMAQPLHSCLEGIRDDTKGRKTRVICMSPQGRPFDQEQAKRLAFEYNHLVLVCGHYEGIDQRFIDECVDEELSLGDFVLTGGEIPAMAVTDAVCRLIPGVLADEECFTGESHWSGLLEYPQYTRPELWLKRRVPLVLLSGDHERIRRWRRKQSLIRTMDKRPDLFQKLELTGEDAGILAEIQKERDTRPPEPVFEYRLAVPEDVSQIAELAAGGPAPDPEELLAEIRRENGWVFHHEGSLAGAIFFSIGGEPGPLPGLPWSKGSFGLLGPLLAADAFWQTNLGPEMLSLAEELSLGKGAQSMRAMADPLNDRPGDLLAKAGYALLGSDEDGRLAYEKRFF